MQEAKKDKICFIGPDIWKDKECPYFKEDGRALRSWGGNGAVEDGLKVRTGRWLIPGKPIVVLVDFTQFYEKKDEIYAKLWEDYQVDSLHGYGDYDEASMFSYAAAKVVESICKHNFKKDMNIIYHGNEWMCGLGLLYINKVMPQIGTVFTTHATSIGRSIAGNNKPLYDYLSAYNGDQMAEELNMQSKHSIEKQTAKYVDCFTTVSKITAKECEALLDKPVDKILPNGFDDMFVPHTLAFAKKRREAKARLLKIANALTGVEYDVKNTLIVSTSGRYEWRNKGIDVFIESMSRLRHADRLNKRVVAFVEVPAWVGDAREDLKDRLASDQTYDTPLDNPFITHNLYNYSEDKTVNMFRYLNIRNAGDDKMHIIFIPCYLTGDDGIVNLPYYDVIIGNDLTVYPSYYEPWGYTPLESVAFRVPCITTSLSGFGLWFNRFINQIPDIKDGVKVIRRTDNNYDEVAEDIKNTVIEFSTFDEVTVNEIRVRCHLTARRAQWSKFIKYYRRAYDIALQKADIRKNQK